MELIRRQNVASGIVFPLIATASRPAYKASATLAAGDFKIIRHASGAWQANTNTATTTPTELGLGYYYLPLTATELNPDDTQYPVIVICHDAAGTEWDDQSIIIWTEGVELSNAAVDDIWDELQGPHQTAGTFGSYLNAQVASATGGAITAATVADAVWDEAKADHTTGTTFGDVAVDLDALRTDYTTQRAGYIDNLSAGAAALEGTLTAIKGDSWATQTLKAIGDYVDLIDDGTNGLTAIKNQTNKIDGAAITAPGSVTTNSLADYLMNKDGSKTFDKSTDSLEAIRDRGDAAWTTASPPSAATIADTVWDELQGPHNVAGSFGSYLDVRVSQASGVTTAAIADAVWDEAKTDHTTGTTFGDIATDITTLITDYTTARAAKLDNLDAAITTRHASGAAVASVLGNVDGSVSGSVNSVVTAVTVGTNNDKTGYSLSSAEENTIADKVWDEQQGEHLTASSFGSYLDARVSQATGGVLTVGAIADAVWDEAKADHTTNTTFGDIAVDITTLVTDYTTARAGKLDNLDAAITTRHASGAAVASVSGSVNSVTTGVIVTTNNDKTGYALSAAGVDSIWDEVQTGHSTPSSFGLYLDATISGVTTGGTSAAEIADAVWNEPQGEHNTAGTTGSYLDVKVSQASGVSAASIADAVWDEPKSGHTTDTTFGDIATDVTTLITDYTTARATKLDNLDAAISTIPTAAENADANWDESRSGHTTTGTFGKYLDAQITSVGAVAGAGANTVVYTVKNSAGAVVGQCDVWVTTDSAGTDVVASGTTLDNGTITLYLDNGTYYVFRSKAGVDFTNPSTQIVP